MLQQYVFKTLENDPLFARQPGEDVSLEKMRELTFRRYHQYTDVHLIHCELTCTFHSSAVTSFLRRENKASDKNPQGKAALPLQLPDARWDDGQPVEVCGPQWLSGHVWLGRIGQVLSPQRGECGWVCNPTASWLSNMNYDEELEQIVFVQLMLNTENASKLCR